MSRLYAWIAAAFAALCMQASALAAPPQEPATQAATESKPPAPNGQTDPLSVTVLGAPTNRVGDVAYVVIALRNVSDRPVVLKNMTVAVDGPAIDRFIDPAPCLLQRSDEITIGRGLTFEQTCRFAMKEARVWAGGSQVQSSLLSADIRLQVAVELMQLGSFQYFPVFTVKAPEIGIFIGGFAGALMLALFVLIERVLKHPEAREAWIRTVIVTLTMGFRGGLMAIIALLLSKTTQGPGSPVSLTVSDFGGGVLIGLFSYPLAAWISSTLKLEQAYVPQAKPGAPN
ncbi:hypothetical protein [Caenimonas aquaedulcis]|uniref:Uncharacterized protein n=1 Tax=Caenimonas aquaedulcis TaxID=2793270 RepID=A0A931H160_9BURK|nr:hypothetical protein [Caenimonas aquaedulcis]MBG9386653.1 hypothetical protein [Caenimonas aquaedulcis]